MDWNLRSVDDVLLELELSGHTDFLIDGVVSSAVTTIIGDPYIGKTSMALDIVRSLITGEPFLGRPVSKTLDRVAFLCTDPSGNITVAQRAKRAGLDGRRVLTQQFYPPESWREWREAVEIFRRERIGAIVVDNTTDIAGDSNDPREVKKITDGLRLWSDNGATILNLHHRNKVGGYFGSTLWQKWTRIELELTGNPRFPNRRLRSKANDAEPVDLALTFDPGTSPAFTVAADELAARRRSRETLDKNARIAEFVKANPGLSVRELAAKSRESLGYQVSRSSSAESSKCVSDLRCPVSRVPL